MSHDPPEDIKKSFSESSAADAATEQPVDDSDAEIAHVTASDDERKRAKREEADQEQQKKGRKKKVKNLGYYGLHDRGDYLRLRGTGPLDRRTNQRQITPEQVKMMLMVAILDKGWTKDLAIYRNGVIDSQLTSMAQTLLATDTGLIKALKGALPQMQKQLKAEPPPWCTNALSRWGHARRFRQQEFENLQSAHTSLKAAEKLGKNFKDHGDGSKSLREEIKEERKKIGGTIMDERMFGALKLRHIFSAKQESAATETVSADGGRAESARPESVPDIKPPAV